MPRHLSLARAFGPLSFCGLLLAACAGAPAPPATDYGATPPNPIQISRTRLVQTVSFAPRSASLESSQLAALFGFIAAHAVGPSDTVIIERGPGAIDAPRAETIQASLAGAGLRPTIVTDQALAAGVTRVVVERYVAIAPDCPNWSAPPGPNFQNYDARNLGCADSKNLAAMVADPKDLAMGAAALPPQVGDPATRPVLNYRTAAPAAAGAAGAGGAAGGDNPAAGAAAATGASAAGAGASGPSGPSGP